MYLSQSARTSEEKILLQKIEKMQKIKGIKVMKWPLWLGIIILATENEVNRLKSEKEDQFLEFVENESEENRKKIAKDEDKFIEWFKETQL